MNEDSLKLLSEAREKAQRLVTELRAQQLEADVHVPDIAPAKLAMGRMALENAIASAMRTLVALNEAWEIAQKQVERESDKDGED